jgi:hypothetical protein
MHVGGIFDVQLKTGQKKGKRQIKVCDDSGMIVEICVWSPAAN